MQYAEAVTGQWHRACFETLVEKLQPLHTSRVSGVQAQSDPVLHRALSTYNNAHTIKARPNADVHYKLSCADVDGGREAPDRVISEQKHSGTGRI